MEITRNEAKTFQRTIKRTLEVLDRELTRLEEKEQAGYVGMQIRIDRLVETMEELEELQSRLEEVAYPSA